MNIADFCIKRKVLTLVLTFVMLIGGYVSFQDMSRLEDPEFTIKQALVITPYPGASAGEVQEEVTDRLETALQQMAQLKEIESKSERGLSTITVHIKDQYKQDDLKQVWDELRNKVSDAQSQLPPGAAGSIVQDDFGDVYGVYFVLYGDDYSYAELKEVADMLRKELLLVDDVAKIDIHGNISEAIYIEPKWAVMAKIGLSTDQIIARLSQQNLVRNSGRIQVNSEYIAIDPTGEISSVADFETLTFSSNGRQFRLRDIAHIRRGYVDPPSEMVRYNGHRGVAIGISTVTGGNVVHMGEAIDERLDELRADIPLGMELGTISHQASSVTTAISGFTESLILALVIVIAVLMLFMGLRSGLLIGFILVLTIMGSFIVLEPLGVALERISLGALIIALGMLVDNAIVVVDGILVGMKRGRSAYQSAIDTVKQSATPLLGATAIAIFAFAAIGTTDNNAGEFCRSLFTVICVSLSLSWVTAITVTPLLAVMFFGKKKEAKEGDKEEAEPFSNGFYKLYKGLLKLCIRFKFVTAGLAFAAFVVALIGFGSVKQSFFPPSTRPQYMVDFWLPQGTHINETSKQVTEAEKWLMEQEGVTNVSSVIGQGALRFMLSYAPEMPNTSYAQIFVDVEDSDYITDLIERGDAHFLEKFPDAHAFGVRFELGPGGKGKIQAQFSGSDPNVLRDLAQQASAVFEAHPNSKAIYTDWRERVKLLRPQLADERAILLGIDKKEIASAIKASFEGQQVGIYREGDLLLPIVIQAEADDRSRASQLEQVHIWSPVANQRIPLSQVISGMEIVHDDEIMMRLDRKQVITAFCDPIDGTANSLLMELKEDVEAIPLPDGYTLSWQGEYKDSREAQESLAQGIPMFFLLMILTTVALFNSVRQPLVIWLCVPLSLIGVAAGLLIFDEPFSFMAILGFLSLSGMLIKNAIVMLDELNAQLEKGSDRYDAIINSAASRLLPVAMAASTTALGMLPLFFDSFFASMAVTIVFGLLVATVLTTVLVPVFYAILYRVRRPR
ncbi:efflux RND transporter permease subunit [Persicirhabdus sediminis]|uniref:Efflux RND transporter permease subunit n=1 Tax=Persicirhabdus sediminis TaxID=454144 RepID=A0A8J7MER5_9BACT|nr:efflux RND transporter permease subunit [Persicirhabdus sediminis]MBK1791333.1 efflux RND transporter permease subunit [Persicirhabdus sediminis]